jgi:hypothetical protein
MSKVPVFAGSVVIGVVKKRSCRAKQDEEHREATASTADLTRTASKEGCSGRRLRAASGSVEY